MPWLAGVLADCGFESLSALDFYTSATPGVGIDREEVGRVLSSHPAEAYLFSPMTVNLPFAYEIASLVKERHPGSATIFGGVAATPLRAEVASHPDVDYVVYDRAEYALPALLRTIEGGGDRSRVGNLAYKGPDGQVVTNEWRYPWMPAREIPFPRVDLFPGSVGEDLRYLRQVYQLGCPYNCAFCTIQTIDRTPDYFPLERVLAEIRAYRAHYGPHHNIYWGDETFTLHSGRTLELCQALAAEGGVHDDCQTRLNCLTDARVLRGLRQSGCRWIEIGIEAGDQETQNLFKQRVKLGLTEDLLARLRDEGIAACSFLVNGFPNQTLDDMKRSIEWTCRLIGKDLLQASYLFGLVPYPGSQMFEDPERFGMRILHRDFRYYHEDMPPVFETPMARPDAVYRQFLAGVKELGEAMGKKPYFGEPPPPAELDAYGTFWSDAHV